MITKIAIGLGTLYLVGAAILYVFQRDFLYFPSDKYQYDLPVLKLQNEGEQLDVLVLNPGKLHAIIYFGGNAEPVIFNEQPFLEMFPDHTVYLHNYRGYGGSSGVPTESALFSDALALFDKVVIDHRSVSSIGRSLGSGVAVYLASKRPLQSLALVTPFDSIQSVVRTRFPIYPISWMLKDKYDSITRVSELTIHALILIAELDQVIPKTHSFRLANAFRIGQVSTEMIPGTDHNNVSFSTAYKAALENFFSLH